MEMMINSLLRPYRATYSYLDLGKKRTEQYTRIDDCILNDRDQKIQYSYYQHLIKSDICVIYCHCNSGSRIQGIPYLNQLISKGWNVCLFDFSGSGQSEGSHISLGHYEAKDLECIIKKMRDYDNKKFHLWGRSMGAATIIFYLNESKYREFIIACVLDSPYISLWSLIKQIGSSKSMLPGFIIEHILQYIRNKIRQIYFFDIKQLEPIKYMGQIQTPIFFITSTNDEFIACQDIVKLYKATSSKNRQIQYIDKAHNSSRQAFTIQLGVNFLCKSLLQRQRKKKKVNMILMNNKSITGGNMADLIVKVQKQKNNYKKNKSQINIDPCKQNKSKYNNNIDYRPIKTECLTSQSTISFINIDSPNIKKPKDNKRRTIKFSLAHLQQKSTMSQTNIQNRANFL